MGLIRDGGMRRNYYGVPLAFVLIMAFSIVEPGHTGTIQKGDQPDALPPSVERIQQGKALYEGLARCIHCHGQTAVRRPLTKQELFSIIKLGVPGTSHMPFQHLLSDEEIWSIVQYQFHDTCMNGCAKDPP
ncbi:MAG: cytochrome c [Nitrospirales bacterium]|nr:cytochrome c [Nitrospirales bacterium]